MARILIIDDEEPIRFSLRGILEDEGYEVLEAATAEEGIEVADAERPDLVFLDIWLPGMDGLTAQARLKGCDLLLQSAVFGAQLFNLACLAEPLTHMGTLHISFFLSHLTRPVRTVDRRSSHGLVDERIVGAQTRRDRRNKPPAAPGPVK